MFPHDAFMVRLSRDLYNERLQEAEAARRVARNRTETGVGLTDRLAVQIGDMLISLGHQIKHQRDWQATARSSRA